MKSLLFECFGQNHSTWALLMTGCVEILEGACPLSDHKSKYGSGIVSDQSDRYTSDIPSLLNRAAKNYDSVGVWRDFRIGNSGLDDPGRNNIDQTGRSNDRLGMK